VPADRTAEARVEHCVLPGCIERVHHALASLWEQAPDVPDLDRMMFETAVVEVTANVIEHAERGDDFDAHVVLRVAGRSLVAELADTGAHVDVDLDAELPDDDLATTGRGIPLARRAVHEISYRRGEGRNHWRLVRHWQG
jgi:serine/threonine-protein kinase RsbW